MLHGGIKDQLVGVVKHLAQQFGRFRLRLHALKRLNRALHRKLAGDFATARASHAVGDHGGDPYGSHQFGCFRLPEADAILVVLANRPGDGDLGVGQVHTIFSSLTLSWSRWENRLPSGEGNRLLTMQAIRLGGHAGPRGKYDLFAFALAGDAEVNSPKNDPGGRATQSNVRLFNTHAGNADSGNGSQEVE